MTTHSQSALTEQELKKRVYEVLTSVVKLPESQREEALRANLTEEATKLSKTYGTDVNLKLESFEVHGDRVIGIVTHNLFSEGDIPLPVVKFLPPVTGTLSPDERGDLMHAIFGQSAPPDIPESDSKEANEANKDWMAFIGAAERVGPASRPEKETFEFQASVKKMTTSTESSVLQTKVEMTGHTPHSWNTIAGFGEDVRASFSFTGGDADTFFQAGKTYKVTVEKL